jgi:hypothetical protein
MIAAGRPSHRQLVTIRRTADPPHGEYRMYGGSEAARHALARELSLVWWKFRNWYRRAPTRSTRTLPQGGLLVACLGADGAGKSTVVGEIAQWLSHEVAVVTTYGGNGKGSAGWARGLMQSLGALRRRVRGTRARPATAPDGAAAPRRQEVSLARALWVETLSGERRARALEARVARGRGMVVVSDRWPQSQFPGWNDGPRLDGWLDDPSAWRRAAARRERDTFQLVARCPPDLVVKLHVPPEVAARRKPETPAVQLETGVELLRRLSFPPTTKVIDIDATQPLRQVVLQVKRAIWDAL